MKKLKPGHKGNRYMADLKKKALVLYGRLTAKEVSDRLDIPQAAISRWSREASKQKKTARKHATPKKVANGQAKVTKGASKKTTWQRIADLELELADELRALRKEVTELREFRTSVLNSRDRVVTSLEKVLGKSITAKLDRTRLSGLASMSKR